MQLTAQSHLWEFLWALLAALCCCSVPPSPCRYTGKDKEEKASSCFHRYLQRRNGMLRREISFQRSLMHFDSRFLQGAVRNIPESRLTIRILKLLFGSTYKFFRQQEQQLKNGMAAFLNKYITYIFSPKQYLLLCNLSNTVKSAMWILNPSPVPRMDMVKWITCCPQTHLDRWHSRSTLFKEDFSINSIFRR